MGAKLQFPLCPLVFGFKSKSDVESHITCGYNTVSEKRQREWIRRSYTSLITLIFHKSRTLCKSIAQSMSTYSSAEDF